MSDVALRLDAIILKTKKILQQSENYKLEAEGLRSELILLRDHIERQEKTIEELNEKIKIIKLARSLEESPEKAELKRKLNEYIKEVDRCMTLLNE
ncbi:MAG: hypothetical protein U0T73_09420 [Chitinophagales bacterium]